MFQGPNQTSAREDSDRPWWIDEFVRPINADLQAGNEEGAKQYIANARLRQQSGDLDEDNARALELFLLFLEFKGARLRLDEMNSPMLFDRAKEELSRPQPGPVSSLTASMLLLELLVNGHHLALYDLSLEEFRQRFTAVPPAGRTHHFWYYTSGYAFLTGDENIVTEAYKLYLINPSGSADYYTVQRLKLMLLLMQNRADKKDVLELIKRISSLPQITEFNLVFYPRVEGDGLVDEDILSACAQKEGEILTMGPVYLRVEEKEASLPANLRPRFKSNI
jgi:hypothetical protein